MPSISARIPDDEREALDEVAELLGEDRSTTIRKRFERACTTCVFESLPSGTSPAKCR